MGNVRILEVKQSIFASNDEQAAQLRQSLKEKKIFLLNLMSAPGSGKTTTLRSTIAALKDELRIGVMEADIDSDVALRIWTLWCWKTWATWSARQSLTPVR